MRVFCFCKTRRAAVLLHYLSDALPHHLQDIQDGAEQCQQWRWMEDRHVWCADVHTLFPAMKPSPAAKKQWRKSV